MNNPEVYAVERTFKSDNCTGYSIDMHCRPTNGLVLVEKGRYIYTSSKGETVSDSAHVIFLPKGAAYRLKCLEADNSRIIHFSGVLPINVPFSIPVSDQQEMLDIFDKMMQSQSKYYLNAQLFYLLFLIFDKNPVCPALLRPQTEYMREHFTEMNIRNEQLAAMSNISTVYFRKLFTSYYKMSPQNYMKKMRVEKAKQLLRSGEYTVSQAAVMCGYENIYSFSTTFKKEVGKSPTAYAGQLKLI